MILYFFIFVLISFFQVHRIEEWRSAVVYVVVAAVGIALTAVSTVGAGYFAEWLLW